MGNRRRHSMIEHLNETLKTSEIKKFDPDKRIDTNKNTEADKAFNPDKTFNPDKRIEKEPYSVSFAQKETGWPNSICEHIKNNNEYKIYKSASLQDAKINGRECLIKSNIDLNYVDPKTGFNNLQRMKMGRSPIDSATGETIELHHMGQEYESPLAELTESEHTKNGNFSILHDANKSSFRRQFDSETGMSLGEKYKQIDKPRHWQSRAA